MSYATGNEQGTVISRRSTSIRLADRLRNPDFRRGYLTRQFKAFLAAQLRALRGDKTQKEFGRLIGKPQNVVSRLENEHYGQVNIQTLLDMAVKLDVALIVRFVDYPTFLDLTRNPVENAAAPVAYDERAIDRFIGAEVARESDGALKALFSAQTPAQASGESSASAALRSVDGSHFIEQQRALWDRVATAQRAGETARGVQEKSYEERRVA